LGEINGFILDIDGTLLNSTPAHLAAWKYAFEQHNIIRTPEEIVKEFSKPTPTIAAIVSRSSDENLVKLITKEKTDYFIELIPTIPLYPRVLEVMDRICELGGKICFASSNLNRAMEKMMSTFDWRRRSVGYLGIDDITHAKPHPEMIHKAVQKMELNEKQCVMVGDSLYDIQAGNAAGTYTIGVCTGINTHETFKSVQPTKIINSFGDLYPELPLSFN
jgi:pyrophosphatase PpaX